MTERKTSVRIAGDAFLINDEPIYAGRYYQGMKIEGLLLNARLVQGIFDDLNAHTRSAWDYPDGPWDAERNNSEFIAAMPAWRAAGLRCFTINLQGGSPQGYSQEQPWINSAFSETGALRDDYMLRLARILDAADRLGMVVITGLFYFGQDQRLENEAAVIKACENYCDWLLAKQYHHVLLEVANEIDVGRYSHDIIQTKRCHELIMLLQQRSQNKLDTAHGRFLVSTSTRGNTLPGDNIVAVADFLLLHGNHVSGPERIREMVQQTRANPHYRGQPVLFNEDDHFAFEAQDNHMLAAISQYAGWGYFDYRMNNEDYADGFQSVPVDWSISSARKRAFFALLSRISGIVD